MSGEVLTQRRRGAESSVAKQVRLGDVCRVNTSVPSVYDGVKPYVSTGAVENDRIDDAQVEYWNYSERPSRANLYPSLGDVLFAKMRATRKTLLIDESCADRLYSTGFYALTPITDKINTRFLIHYLQSDEFLRAKDKECKGATQKALNGDGFRKLTIKLPYLPDQRRIAAKLDRLCDIVAKRKQQLSQLQQLVKSQFVEAA